MALRVLLADESTTIKKVMQLALQDFAVDVKSVQSGVDVVEVAKSFEPDIIFADVLLQKKNGYEVCAELKRHAALKAIPLVLMWSSFMDLDEALFKQSGADRRLEKPFDVEHLRHLVQELVPKTSSQRLAQFLRFPNNVTEPLRKEESRKREAGSVTPLKPQQTKATPLKPNAPESDLPSWLNPPPPTKPTQPGATKLAKVGPTSTKPAAPPLQPSNDEGESDVVNFGADAEPAPSWTMDNFQDINEFADGDLTNSGSSTGGDGDDESFSEFRLTPPAKPVRQPETRAAAPPAAESSAPPDDRDPWSHQDLARFKIDLPKLSVDDDSLDAHLEADDPSEAGFTMQRLTKAPPQQKFESEATVIGPQALEFDPEMPSEEFAIEEDEGSEDHYEIQQSPAGELELTAYEESDEDEESAPVVPQLSADRLEEIVRAQSREIIETVVRRIVPDIAAELIREELHRLLDETGRSPK